MAGYYYHPTNGWTLITSEQMVGLTGGVQIGLWMRRSDANPTATILVDNFTVNSADGYSWFEVKLTNDDFTGTNGDPPDVRKWTTYNNVTIQNNKARGVDGGNITCNFEPTGDFSVRVYWDDVGAGTTNAYWHALNVWMDSDNYMDIAVGYWGSQRQYAVNGKVGGATFQSVVATSHTDGRFSIVRSGVTTSATYWNGTSWVQAGISDEANQTLGTGPAKIALYTSRWSAPPSTIVDWDNFMLLSADSVDWQVGDKVYFTDSDSNKLYAEIETFDVATSAATYHIAVPVVPSGSNTPITMNWDWDSSKTYDVRELPPEDYRDAFTGTNGSSPDTTKWSSIGSNTTIQNNKCNQPIAQGFGNSGTYCYWDFSDVGGSITGNFDVQVDFELITYPNTSFWGAQLVVADTDGEGCSNVRGWYGSQRYYVWINNQGWTANTGTSDVTGKLRVTRVGTTWTCYKWNGSSWDTLTTWDPGTAAPIDTCQIYIRHGNTEPACEVNFDNFQINNVVYIQSEVGDTFTGTNGDPPDVLKWDIILGSPTIQSNALNFSPAGGATERIRTKYLIDDDFDIQIDYDIISLGTNGEIGIRAWQDNNNYLRVHYKDVSGTPRYQTNKMEGGGYSVLDNEIRTDDPGKLRITRVGSTIATYGYWSSAWQQMYSGSHSYLDGQLNIEIECYEQAATTTEVNVDPFQINGADSITGWTEDTGEFASQQVWDSNFKIVTHMAQEPTGSADDILDSTSNEFHGTSYNMDAGNSGSNEFGKYLSFDGTEEFIDFGDAFYSNTGTYEAIINVTNYSNNEARVIVQKRNAVGTANVTDSEMEFDSINTNRPWIGAWDSTPALTVSKAGITGPDTTGIEVYVAGAYDSGGGSDISAQQNDVINTGPDRNATAVKNTASAYQIAARSNNNNNRWFLGDIREVRISDIYRSEAWRTATYYSLLGDIWTTTPVSAYVPAPSGSRTYTIYADWVDEELTWFPVTLSLQSTASPAPYDFWAYTPSPTASKVYFTDIDGNKLYSEIETFDIATSAAVWHIAVPTVSAGDNTPITMNWDWDDPRTYDVREIPITLVNDDFTGTDGSDPNSTYWYVAAGAPSIQSNKLSMDAAAGDALDTVVSNYVLAGDFDIQIDYSSLVMPDTQSNTFELRVKRHGTVQHVLCGRRYESPNQVYRAYSYDSSYHSIGSSTTADTSGKFRITRSGTTVTCYYWNGSWVSLGTDGSNVLSNAPVRVDLICNTWQNFPTIGGDWDNFVVNSADNVFFQSDMFENFAGNDGDAPDVLKWKGTSKINGNKARFSSADGQNTLDSKFFLNGDFDIQVDVDFVDDIEDTSWYFSFTVWDPSTGYYSHFEYGYFSVGGGGQQLGTRFRWYNGSLNDSDFAGAQTTGSWRLRRESGVVYGDYDYGGGSWTNLGNDTGGSVGNNPVYIRFGIARWTNFPDPIIDIDNFQINSADSVTGWTGETTSKPAQQVWDSDYKIVTHMAQEPTGAADDILDSTANENHGRSYNMAAGNRVLDDSGYYLTFDGTNEWIGFGDAFYSQQLTLETISNVTSFITTNPRMLWSKRNVAGTVNTDSANSEWANQYIDFDTVNCQVWEQPGATIIASDGKNFDTSLIGVEVYIASVVPPNENDIVYQYIDGEHGNGSARLAGDVHNGPLGIQLGSRSNNNNNRYFHGYIREGRISNIARSDAWVKATYYSFTGDIWTPVEGATEWTLTIQALTSLTSTQNINFYDWLLSMQDLTVSTSIDADMLIVVWLIMQSINVNTSMDDFMLQLQLLINDLNIDVNLNQMQFWRALKTINNTVEFRTLMRTLVSKSLDRTLDSKTIERTLKQIKQLGHFYDNP